MNEMRTLFTRPEAAKYLRLSTAALAAYAVAKKGPKITRAGGRVLYSLADLNAFLDASSEKASA